MIGENIRRYRKKLNMTLKQLGEQVGYAENSVWQWENNHREPNLHVILQLCDALGISIIELLGGRTMKHTTLTINGEIFDVKNELKQYDDTLPEWMVDEYMTFMLRLMAYCDEQNIVYEGSGGRELLFLPIVSCGYDPEATGILIEVPEASRYETLKEEVTEPLLYLSLGNEEKGFYVEQNIDLSTSELMEFVRSYDIALRSQTS